MFPLFLIKNIDVYMFIYTTPMCVSLTLHTHPYTLKEIKKGFVNPFSLQLIACQNSFFTANLNTNIWRVYFHVRPCRVPDPVLGVFYFSVFHGHIEALVVIHFSKSAALLSLWLLPGRVLLPFVSTLRPAQSMLQ